MEIDKEISADEMIERLEASRIAVAEIREWQRKMSMRERVARAMARRRYGDIVLTEDWQMFLPDADVAIAAMREPTKAMLKAGADQGDIADEGGWISGTPSQVWPAMVDAALSEKGDE